MCGIIGYVGKENAAEILLKGLALLEYRGYDSAGMALLHGGDMRVVKSVGKVEALRPRRASPEARASGIRAGPRTEGLPKPTAIRTSAAGSPSYITESSKTTVSSRSGLSRWDIPSNLRQIPRLSPI